MQTKKNSTVIVHFRVIQNYQNNDACNNWSLKILKFLQKKNHKMYKSITWVCIRNHESPCLIMNTYKCTLECVKYKVKFLYSICLFVYLGVTCKISDGNLKIWSEISVFCEIEISHHNDKRKMAITCLILKIQDWNFVCRPNFDSRTNHVLQLRLSDQVSKSSFFRVFFFFKILVFDTVWSFATV